MKRIDEFKKKIVFPAKAGISCYVFLFVLLSFASISFAAQSAYDLMERANALYREGKFKQAITLYHKAESRGADPVATSFNIANSYYQLNDLPNAAATYRKAIDFSNGTFSPALFNMGNCYTFIVLMLGQ